jgi:PTH1 family peptidyl-tRNA hydrolase
MAEPILVVGLGNPGPQYATTRHNLGFLVADILSDRIGSGFKVHKKSGAEVATGRLGGRSVVLAKPRCYMNESGRQVAPLAKFYSVPSADIVVIHDELDIEFGRIRLKFGGGVAGHNGLRSVGSSLGTNDFQRVRIGIGRPPGARCRRSVSRPPTPPNFLSPTALSPHRTRCTPGVDQPWPARVLIGASVVSLLATNCAACVAIPDWT